MSSRACQEQLKLTQELVAAIVQSRVPDVEAAMRSEFLKQVVASFQWFVSFCPSAGSGDAGATKYGTDALLLMLRACKAKHQEQKATLQDVAPLKVFHWLLPAEILVEVNILAKKVSSSASAIMPVVKSKGGKSKMQGKIVEEDAALKNALDMFK